MRIDKLDIPWGNGPFRRTKRISFELSNRCNWADAHRKCPLDGSQSAKILPESIILSIIETCKKYSFRGVIAFHLYNEPLHDPRLVYFMRLLKRELPGIHIFVLTNGWYLTEELAQELTGHGLDYLSISAYTDADFHYFKQWRLDIPIVVLRENLDDRLFWYKDLNTECIVSRPCYCPLYELCITCDGQLDLCPYDWKRKHILGDLNHDSLENIIDRPSTWEVYDVLAKGNRKFTLCQNCKTYRGEAFSEKKDMKNDTDCQ